MKTFSEILKALPGAEARQLVWVKRLYIGLLLCMVAFVALMTIGWHLKNPTLINVGWIPIFLATILLMAQIAIEVRDTRKMVADSAGWIGGRLDRNFDEEKRVAVRLANDPELRLKSMATRIDAEVISQEKWLDVIKPFSLLVPAVLIIVTSKYLNLSSEVQNMTQLVGAALISGLAVGAVSIYTALVKLRRLSSVLHHAVEIAEERKAVQLRKVSRKRGS
jgi:hypothetical protein